MTRFEVGKFYKHTNGNKIAIVGEVETTMYGKTLVGEQSDKSDLLAVGSDSDDYAMNWNEITKDEWMESFSDE